MGSDMISYLRGKIKYVGQPTRRGASVLLEVNGVGFEVIIPVNLVGKFQLGADAELYTFHHIWQDGQELFGFSNMEELQFFKLLLEAPGIGPKTALHVFEKSSIKDIQNAVVSGDAEALTRSSGIGRKTAEKIVVGLKDHLKKILENSGGSPGAISQNGEVIEALLSLGFSPSQAREAIARISKETVKSEDKIKEALKILGRR